MEMKHDAREGQQRPVPLDQAPGGHNRSVAGALLHRGNRSLEGVSVEVGHYDAIACGSALLRKHAMCTFCTPIHHALGLSPASILHRLPIMNAHYFYSMFFSSSRLCSGRVASTPLGPDMYTYNIYNIHNIYNTHIDLV